MQEDFELDSEQESDQDLDAGIESEDLVETEDVLEESADLDDESDAVDEDDEDFEDEVDSEDELELVDEEPANPRPQVVMSALPITGEPRVDDALARLTDLSNLPVHEHVAVFEDVQRRLHETLADLSSQ